MTPPSQWSIKTHVLTWVPVAAFTVTLILNWQAIADAWPVATKSYVTASVEALKQQVDTLLIFRLKDEIKSLTDRRDSLNRLIARSEDASDISVWRAELVETLRKLAAFNAQLNQACDTPQLRLFC